MHELWWKNIVIYEVYVDKFAGNFSGLIEKLDYLVKLGVNCIWILPHYPSPMKDGGYDVSDYFAVRKELGTLEDFKNFTEQAHSKGIRIFTDLVLNHTSTEHPWFKEASSSRDNPKRDYYIWSEKGDRFKGAYKEFSHIVPKSWTFNSATEDYYFSTFYSEQADLNWDNSAVFKEIFKVMAFWKNYGVDGFRLDAVSHMVKRENTDCHHLPEVHRILKKIRRRLDAEFPGTPLLGEAGGSINKAMPYFGTGDECQMMFNFDLIAQIYLALKKNNSLLIQDAVKRSSNIPASCQWVTFINNHDEVSFKALKDKDREELIQWLDSSGKYFFPSGQGIAMRLGSMFKNDKESIKNIFKTLFNLPGSPAIYYGSELGMKNTELTEKPADVREYVRGEFDWTEAEEQIADPDSILNFVSALIRKKINS
jgi:maltose alpha-D-glucosyltransferase/alpha-amylase